MRLSALFLSFVVAVVLATAAAALRFLRPGYRIAGLGGWVAFAAALGVSGMLANETLRPPAIVYVFIPTFALVAFWHGRAPEPSSLRAFRSRC